MAKTGLIFYQNDTDRYQDMKIKRLKKQFSCSGIAIWDYVLNEIYRVEGSFLVWNEDCAFDVSDYFGIKESLVKEVINYCASIGLFNKELFSNESTLTSKAIQTRYVTTCKKAKRKNYKVPEHLDLLRVEMPKVREETPKVRVVSDIVEYSIVENSKVKKSREDVYYPIAKIIEAYLADERIVSAVISNKDNKLKDKEHLKTRLKEFEAMMIELGRSSETWTEFTTYFRNWNKSQKKAIEKQVSKTKRAKINLV
jgi:hypothetical protein